MTIHECVDANGRSRNYHLGRRVTCHTTLDDASADSSFGVPLDVSDKLEAAVLEGIDRNAILDIFHKFNGGGVACK